MYQHIIESGLDEMVIKLLLSYVDNYCTKRWWEKMLWDTEEGMTLLIVCPGSGLDSNQTMIWRICVSFKLPFKTLLQALLQKLWWPCSNLSACNKFSSSPFDQFCILLQICKLQIMYFNFLILIDIILTGHNFQIKSLCFIQSHDLHH